MTPSRLTDAMRSARTAAYWAASPIDRIALWITRRGHLPPLWLRRHTGAPTRFESAALEMAEFIDRLGLIRENDVVLDIGCGPGAMVPHISARLRGSGRYIGFDTHRQSIQWCRRRYTTDSRLSFEYAVGRPAQPSSSQQVLNYRFPAADGQADLILAKSVFTHLLEPVVRHYLAEIRRTLRPGRAAVVTAFLFDADGSGQLDRGLCRAFPQADPAGAVRWRRRLRPASAVAYRESFFREMIEAAGLRVQWMSPGFFPGGDRLLGQDTLLIGY